METRTRDPISLSMFARGVIGGTACYALVFQFTYLVANILTGIGLGAIAVPFVAAMLLILVLPLIFFWCLFALHWAPDESSPASGSSENVKVTLLGSLIGALLPLLALQLLVGSTGADGSVCLLVSGGLAGIVATKVALRSARGKIPMR